jgi:ribosomal protein S18 acetylase RimI-like enzyme
MKKPSERVALNDIGSNIGEIDRTITKSVTIGEATVDDAAAILALQKRAFIQEAELQGDDYNITPITEKLPDMLEAFRKHVFLKAMAGSLIIGSVRARLEGEACLISRLAVEPIFQRRGCGRKLLDAIEKRFPGASRFELFTTKKSGDNVRFYEKAGYETIGEFTNHHGFAMVSMEKRK